MTTILPTGHPLTPLAPGKYVATDPATDLDPSTYIVEAIGTRTEYGASFNLQTAYRIDVAVEFYRANISTSTADWMPWAPRSGSGGDVSAASIVGKLDTYFGSTAWRLGTDLDVTNHDDASLEIVSSTGESVTLPEATETQSGLMTAEDVHTIKYLVLDSALPFPFVARPSIAAQQIVVRDDNGKARPFNLTDVPGDAIRTLGRALNSAAPDETCHVKIWQFSEVEES